MLKCVAEIAEMPDDRSVVCSRSSSWLCQLNASELLMSTAIRHFFGFVATGWRVGQMGGLNSNGVS